MEDDPKLWEAIHRLSNLIELTQEERLNVDGRFTDFVKQGAKKFVSAVTGKHNEAALDAFQWEGMLTTAEYNFLKNELEKMKSDIEKVNIQPDPPLRDKDLDAVKTYIKEITTILKHYDDIYHIEKELGVLKTSLGKNGAYEAKLTDIENRIKANYKVVKPENEQNKQNEPKNG